jgi:hypothetical protein
MVEKRRVQHIGKFAAAKDINGLPLKEVQSSQRRSRRV